jgi:hypothetical protein
MKVYGPYYRKDGRQHVVIIGNGKRRSVSYPKYIMEQMLGRELDPILETVDHIDGDFTNNDYANLRIIPLDRHTREDARRANLIEITCVFCGKQAWKRGNNLRHAETQQKAGPFCSRQCAGKYGAELQNGRQEKLNRELSPAPTYFKNKK